MELCGYGVSKLVRSVNRCSVDMFPQIITLAAECSPAKGDGSDTRGRGENIGRKSRNLKSKLKKLRAGNSSSRKSLCFASRDVNGTCLLWNWPSADPVKNLSDIPCDEALEQVFDDVDLTETSRWREQRYRWNDESCRFTLRASTETNSPGCAVDCNYGGTLYQMLDVFPFDPRPDDCECVARIEFEDFIVKSTMHACERREGGVLKTIVSCATQDGTLAVFELVRLPEKGSAQPL
jgi:hypothetical protein